MVNLNIGAVIKQASERREGLADDVITGFKRIVVCDFWNVEEGGADECAFDGLTLFHLGTFECEVALITIRTFPVEGEINFFATRSAFEVIQRTQYSELFAVYFIEEGANA